MKTQLVIGFELLGVAVVLFGTSLPFLLSDNCVHLPNGFKRCAQVLRPTSFGIELPISVFGIAFAIGGIGLLALNRMERVKLKESTDL